ncbi:histidine kinase [bacterium SCSIO 12741]|nr:histidine kinase [bacterium SCSIO 12741]
MLGELNRAKWKYWVYHLLFYALLFGVFALDGRHEVIEFSDLPFFLFYTLVAAVINYVLIPRFFYTKKLGLFWGLLAILMLILYVAEEMVLEPLFVGGKRAAHISNVFFTLFSILPILFMMVGFKLALDALQKQQELEELKGLVKESELRYLKSQINPHFLFNHLNNLYSYAIEQSPKTPGIILELSSVLRYMLYDCKEDYVPLSKEMDHLKNFTALSELQIEQRGKVNYSAHLNTGPFKIAPLLLSVFVENAFKHSVASQAEDIEIDIQVEVDEGGQLRFSCSNSYQQTSNTDSLSQGIGLHNVKKRLHLLYPDRHTLDIDSSQEQFRVHLTLQLEAL